MMKEVTVLSLLLLAAIVLILMTGATAAQADTLQLYLDVKPGSCVNPLNVKSNGVLTMAILGTEEFDVTTIDPESLLLEVGEDGLEPNRVFLDDVGAPPEADGFNCGDCPVLEPDGYPDLAMKFRVQEVVAGLGFVPDALVELEVTGLLEDDTPFLAIDCVLPLHVLSLALRSDISSDEGDGKMRQRSRGKGQ